MGPAFLAAGGQELLGPLGVRLLSESLRRSPSAQAAGLWLIDVMEPRLEYRSPYYEAMLAAGKDVLFDIDWQGAQQLFQIAGGDVVRVFIFPPSMEELRQRLERRATDSIEVIDARMARATNEVSHWDGYDYVLVNDDVEQCFLGVKTILQAERLKRSRQTGLIGFIRKLTTK